MVKIINNQQFSQKLNQYKSNNNAKIIESKLLILLNNKRYYFILIIIQNTTMIQYEDYRSMDPKLKKLKIQQAKQLQINRKDNPQGNWEFDQYRFIDFFVEEDGKQIRLETYRFNGKSKSQSNKDQGQENVQLKQQPLGIIFMFHGLNSHIGHGAHLAAYFSQYGLTTVGFDYRGFGRSEGRPGYVHSLKQHLQDCSQFVDKVIKIYPHLPRFALGLSLGGMTSYYLTLQNPGLFNGAILMAPALKNSISNSVVKIAGVLKSILPNKTKLVKPVYGKASKNPAITDFVKQDKYAFCQRASLSTLQMLLSTMKKSAQTFPLYNCPFMIIQGGLDKLVNPEVAFELYDESATKKQDKQILFYENMWHDIWHQQQIYQIMPKIAQWIMGRIKIKKAGKVHNNVMQQSQ